jgi:hypothetical protein
MILDEHKILGWRTLTLNLGFLQHIKDFEPPKNLRYSFYISGIKFFRIMVKNDSPLSPLRHGDYGQASCIG